LFVSQADESVANRALLGATAAHFVVVMKLLECEFLIAVLANFWSKLAPFFVRAELTLHLTERAILACHFGVGFCFVFLFVSFRHDFTALSTLVVHPCTTDVVHAKLSELDLAFTRGTLLSLPFRLRFNHNSNGLPVFC